MSEIPFIPENAPFTSDQRAWINGYLAGFLSNANGTQPGASAAGAAPALAPLTILYGSQTGSAEALAKRLAKEATTHGFASQMMELNDYEKAGLTSAGRLAIITSTWGDGDPPDNAVAFWEFLNSDAAPKLDHLSYSVLALGDSNYAEFCGAGVKFDEKLEALGAKRIHPRAECDVDYDEPAGEWIKGFWSAVKTTVSDQPAAEAIPAESAELDLEEPKAYSRKNPYPAKLLTNLKLNTEESSKDTRHFEISLDGSGLEYEVGDALGVVPANCPDLANDLITLLGADGEEAVVTPDGTETSLRHALIHNYVISQPTKKLLKAIAERSPESTLVELLKPESKTDLENYLWGREVYDILVENPSVKLTPTEFVELLNKLQPRLYSISSSPKAHPGEVHLTVGVVAYESHGRKRKGVCSTFLADRVQDETPVPVFVQKAHGFRLPESGDTRVIMVGPGTGIAPFRAFLEERKSTGAKGGNWLFFGDQHEKSDFLYRDQLTEFQSAGCLTHLHTAFSRDQKEKVYVQDRMIEHAEELYKWLEEGAHFYVCGDAKRMAKDVDAALHKVIETVGGKTADEAAEYVKALKSDKRYQRDVY